MLAYAAAAVPIATVVVVDPAGWFPFGPAKWAAVSVALGALVIGLARERAVIVPRRAAMAWLMLLGWLLLATVVAASRGDDPIYVWVGTPERHLGLLTWLLFAGAFVAGAQLRHAGERLLVQALVLAALFSGTYATVERLAGRPVEYLSDSSRLGGPFGSASYLGAASCVLVPVAVAVACDAASSRTWRIAANAAAVTGTLAAVGSGARAAWLGLATAGIVVVAARRPSRRAIVGVALAVVAAIAAMTPRLDDIVERDAGASSRLDEWSVAGRVLADRPIVGAGPEGYRIVMADGVDAAYEREHGRAVQPDRAHSGPLDVALVGGVPAALAYLALLAMVAVAAWRSMRRSVARAGLGAAAVAFIVQQFVLFPIAELDAVFWLIAGVLVVAEQRTVVITPRRAVRGGAQAAGIVLLVAAAVGGVLDVAADRLAARAVDDPAGASAVADARRAVRRRPDVARYRLLEATVADAAGTRAGADAAIAATERALELSPGDPIVRRHAATARSRRAEVTGVDGDVAAAIGAWRVLVHDDPHCFVCQLELGDALAMAGAGEAAEEAWITADRLTDRDPTAASRLQHLADQEGRAADAARWRDRVEDVAAR